ncbi:6928_t:CDS:10 [Entrophospora sp. SA101]|nr:6928_t:CDS:10 [Entrophospora sp. SA101]
MSNTFFIPSSLYRNKNTSKLLKTSNTFTSTNRVSSLAASKLNKDTTFLYKKAVKLIEFYLSDYFLLINDQFRNYIEKNKNGIELKELLKFKDLNILVNKDLNIIKKSIALYGNNSLIFELMEDKDHIRYKNSFDHNNHNNTNIITKEQLDEKAIYVVYDESRRFRGFCFVYFNNKHRDEKMDLGEDGGANDVNGKMGNGGADNDYNLEDLKLHIIPKIKWNRLRDEYLNLLQNAQEKIPHRILYAENIPSDWNKSQLLNYLNQFGDVEMILYETGSSCCYIQTSSGQAATKILDAIASDNNVNENLKIRVVKEKEEERFWLCRRTNNSLEFMIQKKQDNEQEDEDGKNKRDENKDDKLSLSSQQLLWPGSLQPLKKKTINRGLIQKFWKREIVITNDNGIVDDAGDN